MSTRQAQPLNVAALPLSGRHLIEASAGTGKTFNITRLYLRLIVEQGLSVTQLLVMTFTKAATQELKGRISDTLRKASIYWNCGHTREKEQDPVFESLFERVDVDIARQRIALALAELDEAAVFTLHSFCQRVIKKMSFETGSLANMTLLDSQEHYVKSACQDWFRLHQSNASTMSMLATQQWHTPEKFLAQFNDLVYANVPVQVVSETTLEASFQDAIRAMLDSVEAIRSEALTNIEIHRSALMSEYVQAKPDKEAERIERFSEFEHWLRSDSLFPVPEVVGKFLNANNYRGKTEVKAILAPSAKLRSIVNDESKKLSKRRDTQLGELPAFTIAADAVEWIKRAVKARKSQHNEMAFDDLITTVANAVCRDKAVAHVLFQEYPVALIDEFQDTDESQYQILKHVYSTEHLTQQSVAGMLMMIGDPKQAIYSFRGGDIYTYLEAKNDANHHWVMDTNWRSVSGMVNAYNRLFWGAPLEQPPATLFGSEIEYEPVKASDNSAAANRPMIDPADDSRPPLTLFYAETSEHEPDKTGDKQTAQTQLLKWSVEEIHRLLAETSIGDRALLPADIAMLVRDKVEAQRVRDALMASGLNAVFLSDKTPLFESVEAHDVLRVLTGIWYLQSDNEVVRALSSPLLGTSIQELATMQSDVQHVLWGQKRAFLAELRDLWLSQGCLTLLLTLVREYYAPTADEERAITNVMHIAEQLQQLSQRNAHPLQIIQWLSEQTASPDKSETAIQRLESDADLIKIVTQHSAKGLEYPIVFVPFSNEYRAPDKSGNSERRLLAYYDPVSRQRVIQLGRSTHAVNCFKEQSDAESMRLLYVAITRAEYRCYLGIADRDDSRFSPLGRALHVTTDNGWKEAIVTANDQTIGAVSAYKLTNQNHNLQSQEYRHLQAQTFNGSVNRQWRLHSFSSVAKDSVHSDVTQRDYESVSPTNLSGQLEVEDVLKDDNRFIFAKGAHAGNFLHDVLEHNDFDNTEWQAHVIELDRQYHLVRNEKAFESTARWLTNIVTTPLQLGTAEETICLAQLKTHDTLKETHFYFPLSDINASALNKIVERHRQCLVASGLLSEDNIRQAPQLKTQQLQGMMHGFIDLVMRCNGKYYVVDYKSTYLGDTFDNYAPEQLAQNNLEHQYDVQYLIYSLALHRYLSNVIPDYSVERHFGGVAYLYLRGMHPKNSGQQGVFYTSIDAELLAMLSQSLTPELTSTDGASTCSH